MAKDGGKPVVRLNDATFRGWVERRPPLTLVLVGSAACAQSRELEPMVAEAGVRHAGRVAVATLDMDDSPEMVERHKIDGVPTILLFRDGRQVGSLARCSVAAAELDELIATAER